jgi:hypothetical protein
MGWMTMLLYVADAVLPGRSTRTSAKGKTSSASLAECTELWSSSMDLRSASLGRVTLTGRLLPSLFLTASQSYLALDLVDTLTAPIPTMS